tara:strand:+ start:604 stop:798 length:195 start_codon:yes stop_codon:yes gene_type:complete
MSNALTTFRLFATSDNAAPNSIEFTPLETGMVRIYFSSMGDDNYKTTEEAREVYRALISEGWAA